MVIDTSVWQLWRQYVGSTLQSYADALYLVWKCCVQCTANQSSMRIAAPQDTHLWPCSPEIGTTVYAPQHIHELCHVHDGWHMKTAACRGL